MKFKLDRINVRAFALESNDRVELRAEGDAPRRAVGYGVVYGREVEIFPGFRERIREGAFTESLADGHEVKSFFNHDSNFVLSTTHSDPALALTENRSGVKFDTPIPPTSYGRDLEVNIERGNVRGASFAFVVPEGGDEWTEKKGVYYREILRAELLEIGPVTNPAYHQTSAGLRSAEGAVDEYREILRAQQSAVERAREMAQRELDLNCRRLDVLEKT